MEHLGALSELFWSFGLPLLLYFQVYCSQILDNGEDLRGDYQMASLTTAWSVPGMMQS